MLLFAVSTVSANSTFGAWSRMVCSAWARRSRSIFNRVSTPVNHLSPVLITTIILGNGAGLPGTPFVSKWSRPLTNRISARLRMYCWNHRVSVRAGRSMTTRVSLRLASILHLRTHSAIALPYGGLQNTVSPPTHDQRRYPQPYSILHTCGLMRWQPRPA